MLIMVMGSRRDSGEAEANGLDDLLEYDGDYDLECDDDNWVNTDDEDDELIDIREESKNRKKEIGKEIQMLRAEKKKKNKGEESSRAQEEQPDSDNAGESESDGEGKKSKRKSKPKYPVYYGRQSTEKYEIQLGMKFSDKTKEKEALEDYRVHRG